MELKQAKYNLNLISVKESLIKLSLVHKNDPDDDDNNYHL